MPLHARQLRSQRRGQGARQHGLSHSRHVFDQQVAARQRAMAAAVSAPGVPSRDPAQLSTRARPNEMAASMGRGAVSRCLSQAVEHLDVGDQTARGLPATLTTRSVVASRSPKWAGSIRSTLSARSRPN